MGKYRRISKLIPGIAVFAMPLLWAGSAHADNIAGSAMPVGASLEGASVTVSTDGAVDIEVVPTSTGSLGVGKGEVTVDTTSNSGYTLYISSPNVDADGYAPLYLNGNSAFSTKITSLASSTPASLASKPNQWGFAIPGENNSRYEAALGSSTTDETLINNLTWRGVSSSYTLAKTGNEAGVEKIPIYFGVYANTDIISGNYVNTVVYTAFVEGNGRLAIAPGEVEDGERATITTEYKASGHPVSASDINITMYNNDTNNIMAICNDIQVIQDGSSAPLTFSCAIDKQPEASVIPYDIEVKIAREDGNYYTYVGENSWHFITKMQDITTADVRAMQEGETYTMKDSRDGKKYLIRKLADNKVWMVQNLALEGGQTITSSNSNLPNGVSYPLPDGAAYTSKFSDNKAEHMYNGTHKNAQVNNTSDNTGAYYNWNVATAGYDTAGTKSSGNSDRSICPKGWRLPTSTDSGEFKALYAAYSSNKTNFDAAFNTVYVGYYYSGSLKYSGSYAYWWSSTILDTTNAYFLYENSSGNIDPSYSNGRYLGFSVRCVADLIQTMQDFSSEDAAAMSNGDERILEDVRDGKQYVVRKLADGNVWMTQNLDLNLVNQNEVMGTTNLRTGKFVQFSKSNTNIDAASWTIPEGSQGYSTQTADGLYWNQWGCANSSYSATWAADGANKYDVNTWCATGYEVRSRRLDDCTTYSNAYGTADTIAACNTATGVANTKRNGVMYNYVAATAGSKSYASGAGEAGDSICQKGWRLPTGGVSGEMHAMFAAQKVIKSTAEGGVAGELTATDIRPGTGGNLNVGTTRFGEMITAMASNPISAVRSGYYAFNIARMNDRGAYGQWWSSTATSSTNGYYMEFNTGYYFPGTYNLSKGHGFGVRCIAE